MYIVGLHSMTGCVTTSSFVWIGKLKHFKLAKNKKEYAASVTELRNHGDASQQVQHMLENFVLSLYEDQKETSINKLKYKKAKEMFTVAGLLSDCEGTDMIVLSF